MIIEFLPEYPDALVFDGVDDYISLDAFDSGFKTVFILVNTLDEANGCIYGQRKDPGYNNYLIFTQNTYIAYSYRNVNNTYINGKLNTKIKSEELNNKKHLIHVITDTLNENRIPTIGCVETKEYFAKLALYKFLGFKEALTEEQIQTVIKKYNLLDGVDEIEVN